MVCFFLLSPHTHQHHHLQGAPGTSTSHHYHPGLSGVPEGEEREKGPEKIFDAITDKTFPNLRKETLT